MNTVATTYDVVIARAGPKRVRVLVVVVQRAGGDFRERYRFVLGHRRSIHPD